MEAFSVIQAEVVKHGQTPTPEPEFDPEHHFTAFVSAPDPLKVGARRLLELNGGRKAVVDHGTCSEDLLTVCASEVQLLVRVEYMDNSMLLLS